VEENIELFDSLPEEGLELPDEILTINNPDDKPEDVGIDLPDDLEGTESPDEPTKEPDEEPDEPEYSEEADEAAIGYYKSLVSKGFLEESEEFDGTFDTLEQVMDKSLPKIAAESSEVLNYVAEQIYLNAPEPLQKILQFAFLKPDTNYDELKTFVNNLSPALEEVPEVKDAQGARNYLEGEYSKMITNRTALKAALDTLEDSDEDTIVQEANVRIKATNADLKAQQKALSDRMIEDAKTAQENERAAQEQFSQSVYTELKNTGWTDKRQKSLSHFIGSGKVADTIRQASLNPKAFVQLADLATYFDAKKGEFDFKAYIDHYASSKVKDIKNSAFKDNFGSAGNRSKSSKSKDTSGVEPKFEPII